MPAEVEDAVDVKGAADAVAKKAREAADAAAADAAKKPLTLTVGGKRAEFADLEEVQKRMDELESKGAAVGRLQSTIKKAFVEKDPDAMRAVYEATGADREAIDDAMREWEGRNRLPEKKTAARASIEPEDDDEVETTVVDARRAKLPLSVKQIIGEEDNADIDEAPVTVKDLERVVKAITDHHASNGRKISITDLDEPSQRLIAKVLTSSEAAQETTNDANEQRIRQTLTSDKRLGPVIEAMKPAQQALLLESARNAVRRRLEAGQHLKAPDVEAVRNAARAFAKDAWPDLYETGGVPTDGNGRPVTIGRGLGFYDASGGQDLTDVDRKTFVKPNEPEASVKIKKQLLAIAADIDSEQAAEKRKR